MSAATILSPTKDIILLIGAPGTGKSLIGQALRKHSELGKVSNFFSVGNHLREVGLVDDYDGAGTVSKRKETMERMRHEARLMVEKEIEHIEGGSILVLECVKDIHDAFGLMELLRAHPEAKLLQVLYVSSPAVGRALLGVARIPRNASLARDKMRKVKERQEKWEANMRSILEFFTSLGVMTEVSDKATGPILARLGYYDTTRVSGEWHSALKLPAVLSFTPLQPVVSDRLVTDRGLIDAALLEAEAMSGLRIFRGEAKFIVPSTPVQSIDDARWVTSPGRYCVSRKCDGTRHVLIVGQEAALMLNRVGSVYNYPISTSLPANTVLDGELVWVGGKGFFIAFDVISAGVEHARAWQLPLLDRVALMEGTLSLEEAEACEELKRAATEKLDVMTAVEAWAKADADWKAELVTKSGAELARRKAQIQRSSSQKASFGRVIFTVKPKAANPLLNMSINEWEQTNEYKEWCAREKHNYMIYRRQRDPAMLLLHKKQQASSGTVRVVWKRHLEVSPITLEQLQHTLPDCSYPTDGLVFTPRDAPYALGMAELLRKWQPADKIAADLRTSEWSYISKLVHPMCLVDGLVYECFPDSCFPEYHRNTRGRMIHAEDPPLTWKSLQQEWDDMVKGATSGNEPRPCWRPASIRWDKQTGNSRESLIRLEATALPFEELLNAARSVEQAVQPTAALLHPARTYDPARLYSMISAAVAEGRVERTVDSETGLEIFNHHPLCGTSATPVENICRGLVWHGESKIVATPFVRFSDQHWYRNADHEVGRAAFKVDGSLAIAFLWQGSIHVSTRRRMDSQQAQWARDWLRKNVGVEVFKPDWTYLFEAVYQDNAVVVQYAFDAPVLLAAFEPNGVRLQHTDCAALAKQMGVMLAPSITGTLEEFNQLLRQHTAPPPYEGWIVTRANGSNTKLVIRAYKEASRAKDQLHPLEVWDRVRTGGESRNVMLHHCGLAAHHVTELGHMLDALQVAFDEMVTTVGRFLDGETPTEEKTPQQQAVIHEAKRTNSEPPVSVHYTHWNGHKLRILLMDCIKPSIDGSLAGYSPSNVCVNTIAKGWANGPRAGRMMANRPEPLIHAKLCEPSLLALILDRLEGEPMSNALLVNKEWSRVLLSSPDLERKAKDLVMARAFRSRDSDSDDGRVMYVSYLSDGNGDYSYTGHAGYGSD